LLHCDSGGGEGCRVVVVVEGVGQCLRYKG
jgi:hypothetical protein